MKVLDNYQCEGQITIFEILNPDTWCGKTYQEPLVQTKERTLGAYLRKFAELKIKPPQFLYLKRENGAQADVLWGGKVEIYTHWLGEYTMHSFGEYPNEERESRLSQILEDSPHPKYCLSARACQGILNRAERRGKKLPELLRETLIRQASLSKSEGGVEIDSKGKRAGKGALIQTELSGTLGVSQDQTLITGCLNSWDVQSKHIQPENEKAEALYSGECRGGGGESYVMQNTEVYGICSDNSNSMKSSNPYSGIYKADTTRTLDLNGGNPACNQGGMIVLEGNDQRESHKGDGYKESEIMYTLNTVEQHATNSSLSGTGGY